MSPFRSAPVLDSVRTAAAARLLILWALLGAPVSAPAQRASPDRAPDTSAVYAPGRVPKYRYRLLGVYDQNSGRPIANVQVKDLLSGLSALTSETGTVSLIFLPEGGSLVRLSKLGYGLQTFTVPIDAADTTPLTVVMEPATELPTVSVVDRAPNYLSPMLRDAAARMRGHAGGYFVDEKTMRAYDNSTMTGLLISRMPGMTMVLGAHGEEYFATTRVTCGPRALMGCKPGQCFVSVYVDGVAWVPFGPHTDFNKIWPGDYAIAEYYPGPASTPEQYSSGLQGGACGTLLLWTRER
jgi:hypothetical protein